MISKLLITVPAEVGSLPALGEALRQALTQLHASARTVADVELCVNEAVNNAIERRSPSSRARRVEVQLSVDGDELHIAIGDRGNQLTGEAPEPIFDPDDRASWPEGGMGLYLIRQLMTDVQYQSDPTRNVIHMSCSLKAP